MAYQTVKGTYDLLPETLIKFQDLEDLFRHFLELYGYKEIKTPVFEYTGVFQKEKPASSASGFIPAEAIRSGWEDGIRRQ